MADPMSPPRQAVGLSPLVAELHRHQAAQLGERMLAGSEWRDEDLVFAQPHGRSTRRPTRTTRPACWSPPASGTSACTTAGTPPPSCCCPRTCTRGSSWSCSATVQMRTTMDIYSHVMPALAREAADQMGALLLAGKGTWG